MFAPASAEMLEVRQLLTAQVTLMPDINTAAETGSSDPQELTIIGNTVYFTAVDKTHGRELWKKEGANAAVLVKDIHVGISNSNITELTAVGSTLYFAADDGIHGKELWKSDGTTAGTVLVKDFWGDPANSSSFSFSSYPQQLTNANGKLIYVADPEAAGSGIVASLMTSDGTAAGTQVINASDGSAVATGNGSGLTAVGSEVYFIAWSPGNTAGTELWKSDGTAAGTSMIADIFPGNTSSQIADITPVGNVTYFTAITTAGGSSLDRELFKTDGTAAGTVLVKDINPGNGSSAPANLMNHNGVLYFTADDGTNGRELWKSNGSEAGTVMVKNISGGSSSNPGGLTSLGSTLYFHASDGVAGDELWKSDGTAAGTVMVGHSGTSSNFTPRNLTAIDNTLYFSAFSFETGTELWKSDGTTAGTSVYRDIVPGASPSNPAQLLNVGGTLVYTANDNVRGNELWRHNLTTNVATVDDMFRGTVNSGPRDFMSAGSSVFFVATTAAHGEELWKSVANGTGAVLVKDINPGVNGSAISQLTNVNGILFFTAQTDTDGVELWKSDGTAAGTVKVKDINEGTDTSNPSSLVNLNGTLLLTAYTPAGGHELWKSDGTAAGTVQVTDINPGPAFAIDRFTNRIVVSGSSAYFTANDGANGAELWKTDGTAAGTVMVRDIRTATTGSAPANLVDVNGRLYFTADDGVAGRELWQSDGTAVGTVIAKDTNPGANGAVFQNFVNAGGKLFFQAYSGTGSWDLFCRATPTSDTVNLQMFNASGHTRWVQAPLTAMGTSVYFAQLDNRTGTELWKSDGTLAGTVMVKDIAPTMTPEYGVDTWSSNPENLVNNSGTLFFTANDQVNGRELWMSDGTTAGTVLFKDFTGDAGSSDPQNLTAINGRIFGSVMSESLGREGMSVIDVVTPATPSITAPIGSTQSQRPTITWTASAGAVSYDVFIKNNATGANPQVSVNVEGVTSFTPTTNLGIGKFTVWVRAVSASGTKSNWSAQRDFTVNTSAVPAPMVRNQTTNRPTVVWKDLPGAVKYDVWLDNTTPGQTSTVILHDIRGKSWQSPTDLPLGQYRAWVRGLDASGLAAAWSTVVFFNVTTPPTMTGPLSSTFSPRPQFTWNSVPSATKYSIYVRNMVTETDAYLVHNITTTNWTPPADLAAGTYRWQVRASSASYNSLWANTADFTVGGRPELIGPTGSGNDTTPTFSWKAVSGAASYQIWVDRADTYVQAIINVSGLTGTSYTPTNALPVGTFRVWIRALSSTGVLSDWSEHLTFTITA